MDGGSFIATDLLLRMSPHRLAKQSDLSLGEGHLGDAGVWKRRIKRRRPPCCSGYVAGGEEMNNNWKPGPLEHVDPLLEELIRVVNEAQDRETNIVFYDPKLGPAAIRFQRSRPEQPP